MFAYDELRKLSTWGSDSERSTVRSEPLDGHGGPDRDVVVAASVVVEQRDSAVGAVLPLLDDATHLALGRIQDPIHRCDHGVAAGLVDEVVQAPLGEAHRADLGREIALEVPGVAHVGLEHAQHVLAQLSPVVQAQGRHPDPLVPDLGRGRVVAPVGRAADVGVVRPVHGPEQEITIHEDGHESGQIRQVAAAVVRVVQEEDVTLMHVVPERLAHRKHAGGQRPHVHRDVLGLGDELSVRPADRGREVPARVQDLGERGAQHRLPHLLDNPDQTVLHHRHRNRVDRHLRCLPRSCWRHCRRFAKMRHPRSRTTRSTSSAWSPSSAS
jgi:hypothetical protein